MRTTLSIDDHLLAEAKKRAHEAGTTLGAYVEDALRRDLAVRRASSGPVRLTVSSATGGARPGVDLSSNRGLYDAIGTDVA
ncbi:type II toxin-antitoxin system VapB family antitoxin [Microbacterium sp.]|uniref:type II toxin-antitoxin system VapB family antitoxin n=1 Tax=Microbacterium sp. TaxID=51671 RepID=UPI0039E5B0BC